MTHAWKYSPDYSDRSLSLLDTALTEVAIYQSWQYLDPGPGCFVDDRFAAMPATTKRDIREHFPQGILPKGRDLQRGIAAGEISLVETSGTTDEKIINIWNQAWWDASERASWKLNDHADRIATGEHREAILANPRNVGFISDEIDLTMERRRLARFLYLNEKTDPTRWSGAHMDRMVEELNAFRPAVLEANPSLLARLCRHIAASGKRVFQPGMIFFTYEYPAIFHVRQIRRVLNVPMSSSYGTTETGYVFLQCEEGRWHQNSEFCRVDFEPLKMEHGGPLLGRILVTPFNNPWSCMLRFDTGDLAYLDEHGRCPCGRNSGMILSAMAGRVVNATLTCSGRLVSLYELDKALGGLEKVDAYRLDQVGPTGYELHLVSGQADKTRLTGEAAGILKGLYGHQAEISIRHCADIAPESSGKYRLAGAQFPIEIEKYLAGRSL